MIEVSKPQIIKIQGMSYDRDKSSHGQNLCPFELLNRYLSVRTPFNNDYEQFFIFRDRSPVTPWHFRKLLKTLLVKNNLDYRLYCMHGFRTGMASDLLDAGVSVETIRKLGRWKSNAVYTYLRT